MDEMVEWAGPYRETALDLFTKFTAAVEFEASWRSDEMNTYLNHLCPELKDLPTLEQKALLVVLSLQQGPLLTSNADAAHTTLDTLGVVRQTQAEGESWAEFPGGFGCVLVNRSQCFSAVNCH